MIMAPKKKVLSEAATKQVSKTKLSTYIERYREIEIYLTLLTKPLLSNIIPTTMVGNEALLEKVETEIKTFLEQKLEILTGLAQPTTQSFLSQEETSALKLIASKILNKEVAPVKTTVEEPVAEPIYAENTEEPVEEEVVEDNENVSVRQLEESQVKKNKRKKNEVVLPTEVPFVEKGTATDRMRKVRPMGVKPLPPPSPAQEASMASMQAEAIQQQILQSQMTQAATVMPDNLGMPNFDFPMFR